VSDQDIRPYDSPAGGWDALAATGHIIREQGAPTVSARALLKTNQPDGFDCPGCAWPDPKHTSSFEFCENGAKDFDRTDLILSFGHNLGTNHPRMLSTLRAAARRGVPILVFNPLRERGLERFRAPQSPTEMLTGGSTELATHYFQPRVGTDIHVLQGIMKRLFIARGSCAAYFPEASGLVALAAFDPASRTSAYKSTPIEIQKGEIHKAPGE
jgi:anaerobic selenocysteine-containing dehydrogenase